jgi:DNA-binding HxlR family transcriptional regulator
MDIMDERCTVYRTVDVISKKWTLLILLELYKGTDGTRRYSELKERLPDITPKVLSARLRELERYGLIVRSVDTANFPVKVTYSLTVSGTAFIDVIKAIKRWALRWRVRNEMCEQLDCRECDI